MPTNTNHVAPRRMHSQELDMQRVGNVLHGLHQHLQPRFGQTMHYGHVQNGQQHFQPRGGVVDGVTTKGSDLGVAGLDSATGSAVPAGIPRPNTAGQADDVGVKYTYRNNFLPAQLSVGDRSNSTTSQVKYPDKTPGQVIVLKPAHHPKNPPQQLLA